MIRWTDTSPSVQWPVHENAAELLSQKQTNQPLVLVDQAIAAAVLLHLQTPPAGLTKWFSGIPIEQGGLLIGRITRLSEQTAVEQFDCIEVVASCAAPDATGTALSLRMESTVWQAANELCAQLNTKQADEETKLLGAIAGKVDQYRVIGWYHSHPNLGAFFSATDRQTQAAFFNHDYSLGWVIDPVRSTSAEQLEQAWFGGPQSTEVSVLLV